MAETAIIRHHLERIDGVNRTWFEWTFEQGAHVKHLIVEVNFDTDPNSNGYRRNVMDAIEETARTVLNDDTTMIVSHLRVVPRAVYPAD